jgi:hypothetical protein
MSDAPKHKALFLDELAPDAVFAGSILRKDVSGARDVRRVVELVSGLYATHVSTPHVVDGEREYWTYDATLRDGPAVHGTVVLGRNARGEVGHVSVTQRPLGAVLWIAARLRDELYGDYDAGMFL